MKISILSVFPEIYTNFLQTSLVRRAQEAGLVSYDVDGFRSFVKPKERIDAPTFGPGAGMLIRPDVIEKAIDAKESLYGKSFKVFFSPQGKKLDQNLLRTLSTKITAAGHLMLIPSRYEGMDERVEQHYADEVVSIGDIVLMGGDIPAMMFLEAFLRTIDGVVGKGESVEQESFSGPFLDFPSFAEPVDWKGYQVPEIVRSGNHEAIRKWRLQQAAEKTVMTHFDWMRSQHMTDEQRVVARSCIPNHYVALMHADVIASHDADSETTSVTSIDIHDIARSAKTFGIKKFFIVTPLADQQKIVRKLLNFWQEGVGVDYNRERFEAIKNVRLVSSLDEVIADIEKHEGQNPILIATSAKNHVQVKGISFHDQSSVWSTKRPVLFAFGTGKGLCDRFIEKSDFILTPVEGFSDYNHLSVRSAAAIIFDRWLGIDPK